MDTIPARLALEPRITDPAELPDTLGPGPRQALVAVMRHDAADIWSAIQATASADPYDLLAVLEPAATARAAAEATIAAELREIAATRKTSLLPELADRIEALQ